MVIKPSTKRLVGQGSGRSNAYRALLKDPDVGDVLWACQHAHDNRDNDSNTFASARTCAELVLHEVERTQGGTLRRDVENYFDRHRPNGLHALEDATASQLDWLVARSAAIRMGKAGNAGNRRAYPEAWHETADGNRYRGKLWEKEDDGIRRLFVAGPFGEEEFLDGYVDLTTHEVHLKNKPTSGTLIPLEWQNAAKSLEWSLPQWAPNSISAREEYLSDELRRAQEDGESLEVPAVYRVRVVRQGRSRSYDVVEVQSEEVHTSGLTRARAYRLAAELNEEDQRVHQPVRSPSTVKADAYLYEHELWSRDKTTCTMCGVDIEVETSAVFADVDPGDIERWHLGANRDAAKELGPVLCSRKCGRLFVESTDVVLVDQRKKS